jgi:large subunit ribosomal protein L24
MAQKTKLKIKKGDLVQVITGAKQDRGGDRGKQGKVLKVFPETNRVLVEGINRITKHTKVGQSQRGTKTGGIEVVEASVHISNVARVGYRTETVERDGRERVVRIRVAKSSGKDL